jgi:hypothetical protein
MVGLEQSPHLHLRPRLVDLPCPTSALVKLFRRGVLEENRSEETLQGQARSPVDRSWAIEESPGQGNAQEYRCGMITQRDIVLEAEPCAQTLITRTLGQPVHTFVLGDVGPPCD